MNTFFFRSISLAALCGTLVACSSADSPQTTIPGGADAGALPEGPDRVEQADAGSSPDSSATPDAAPHWGALLGEPCVEDSDCGLAGACAGPLLGSEESICVVRDSLANCVDSAGIEMDLDGSGRVLEVCVPRDACFDVDRDGGGVGPACDVLDCDDYDDLRSRGIADVCNGIDDNCDGIIDNGADVGAACETGLSGMCVGGTSVCTDGVLSCQPRIEPAPELCNGIDDDCDGMVDGTASVPVTETCYDGPEGTAGVGECALGVRTCGDGVFGACDGQVLPAEEVCNGLDDNCDGVTDDLTESCYTGPADTLGVGLCAEGNRACSAGEWGVCMGETTPVDEVCDGLDNDCDGVIDNGCPVDWITPGASIDQAADGNAGNPGAAGIWGTSDCPDDMFVSGLVVTSQAATATGECASGTLDCLGSVQALCSRFEINESRASVPFSYSVSRPFVQEADRLGSSMSVAPRNLHRFECPDGEMLVGLSGVAFVRPGTGAIDELTVECATPSLVAPSYEVNTDAITTLDTLFDVTRDSADHETFSVRCDGGAASGIGVRNTVFTRGTIPDASPVAIRLECAEAEARLR